MTKKQIKEEIEGIIKKHYGSLTALHNDPKENDMRRSELFLDFYETIINIFERDMQPEINVQLVMRKDVTLGLTKK